MKLIFSRQQHKFAIRALKYSRDILSLLSAQKTMFFSAVLILLLLSGLPLYAQETRLNQDSAYAGNLIDTNTIYASKTKFTVCNPEPVHFNSYFTDNRFVKNLAYYNDSNHSKPLPTKKQINTRVKAVASINVLGYAGILYGLSKEWYANYPKSKFHSFNDNSEWLQIDKVGHMYGAYIESRASMELWRWTGIGRNKRILLGGLSGAVYQTVIETLDGFSAQWGWSWGDFSANVLGSGILTAQELAWDDQRIKLKFSFHKNDYKDPVLNKRADEIYGKTLAESFIKDYNAQTYWASANVKSFFPKTTLPGWFNIAIGYGAQGMFGANENFATDSLGNVTFDRRDIKRYRQWYLSPDIDLTKIKTKKKGVRFLLTVLSGFKFPLPSLEFSNGKFRLNALTF